MSNHSFSRGALLEGVLGVEEDAVPAALLRKQDSGGRGHRPPPLGGVATSVAATALANDGKTVGINGTEAHAQRGVRERAGVRQKRSSSPKSRDGAPRGVARR